MALSGRAVHKNPSYLRITIFFIMDACPCQILESTNWFKMKLGL